MATFIKLTININGSIGSKDQGVPALVNLDQVLKITRDNHQERDTVIRGTKITYSNGNTERAFESLELVEKLIKGEPVGTYVDPGEPVPKDA